MTTEELIDLTIETVNVTQTIDDILSLMQDTVKTILPVVENDKFLGFVKEEQLLNITDSGKELKNFPVEFRDNYIKSSEHVYGLIFKYLKYNTTMLAVIGDDGNYKGAVSQDSLRLLFKDWLCFNSQGGIIVLDINVLTYSLSDICKIVESNGAKVFSAEVIEDASNKGKNFLTLKFNTDELTRIIAALERYQYSIVAFYHNAQFENVDQQRLDNFFKFINI